MPLYNPWRDARDRLPHVDIVFVDNLPSGVRGRTHGNTIEIDANADRCERSSTLTHEIAHYDRDCLVPVDPVLHAREETRVERIAARRLVALDQLVDAVRWSRHAPEIADDLWIDVTMLKALIASLTPTERAHVAAAIDDHEVA